MRKKPNSYIGISKKHKSSPEAAENLSVFGLLFMCDYDLSYAR